MKRIQLTGARSGANPDAMKTYRCFLGLAVVLASVGCVQVSAPDKPIEINLNINIRQEVVVRLQQDVKQLIKNNPGVF
ncbi:MAG: YnbE family lipoprotein [Alphaproteobacteria bacterium]|nr:YnbE family lipoprotein [Alphaproteobacteria bacterium]MDB5721179.1 YnbE family lipoprotein [Alphaproteobacteria bacterium]